MKTRTAILALTIAAALALSAGCSGLANTPSVPPKHPEDLPPGRVDCRDCHENISAGTLKPYDSVRHTGVFIREHGLYARQAQNLCASCHGPAFCQACHARKEELKPNTRMGDRPDRMLPHRGDYLVTHRIDGRLDPGSCVPCHGNRNNARCRECHR